MNQATIIKVEADARGLRLRIWVDDERGHHLAVAEAEVPATHLAMWWVQVRAAQDADAQQPLPFD